MKWLINLSIILCLTSCTPVYAYTVCSNELNSAKATKKVPVYLSVEEWQTAYDGLLKLEPQQPSYYDQWSGYTVYRDYREQSFKFRGNRDKKQHCFMGCLVANQINYGTAAYMAWYKEYLDITDCNRLTHFDLLDIAATMKGAAHGVITPVNSNADVCFDWCANNMLNPGVMVQK
jgi:hypothetical protein